ncbi:MAG: MopE-related protein, partial [Bradymonadaceae bacterium]
VTGRDSGIEAPEHTAIDSGVYDEMVLEVRSHKGKQTIGIYWSRRRGQGYSGGRSVRFNAPGDGKFHTIVVPIGHHPEWGGKTIRKLRIDPFENRKPSGGGWWFDLRYVYFQDADSKRTSSRRGFASRRPVRLKNQCSNESCNGKDDDCDGKADEELKKRCGTGKGRCSRGHRVCNVGNWSGCKGNRGPRSESCNGKDDDCDGQADEGLKKKCGKATGRCRKGRNVCKNGSWSGCKGNRGASSEGCNGKDDDCDGDTDEQLKKGCGGGTETCQPGHRVCNGGSWSRCKGTSGGGREVCDGRDNDCDGKVDEDLQKGCGGQTGECEPGHEICKNGSWGECREGKTGAGEVCDGNDNDCDGEVDEGLTKSCGRSTGRCAEGEKRCEGGSWTNCIGERGRQLETCGGGDENCNGRVDEGLDCGSGCPSGSCDTGSGSCAECVRPDSGRIDAGPDAGPAVSPDADDRPWVLDGDRNARTGNPFKNSGCRAAPFRPPPFAWFLSGLVLFSLGRRRRDVGR